MHCRLLQDLRHQTLDQSFVECKQFKQAKPETAHPTLFLPSSEASIVSLANLTSPLGIFLCPSALAAHRQYGSRFLYVLACLLNIKDHFHWSYQMYC